MRLQEFIQENSLSNPALIHILCTNEIPFYIDEDGYIGISLNRSAAKLLLQKHLSDFKEKSVISNPLLRMEINKVIRTEIASIVEEAISRVEGS